MDKRAGGVVDKRTNRTFGQVFKDDIDAAPAVSEGGTTDGLTQGFDADDADGIRLIRPPRKRVYPTTRAGRLVRSMLQAIKSESAQPKEEGDNSGW